MTLHTIIRVLALLLLLLPLGCDEVVEEILDGEEAEHKEPDLPNCSKVINCCENLKNKDIADEINEQCTDNFSPAATAVIDEYQRDKAAVDPGSDAATQLYETARSTVEPGCRCFLEQTIGQVDPVFLPLDCESDKSVGQTEADQCSDATDDLLEEASN